MRQFASSDQGAVENAHTCGYLNKYVRIYNEVNLKFNVIPLSGISGKGLVICHSKTIYSLNKFTKHNLLGYMGLYTNGYKETKLSPGVHACM